MSTCQTSPNAYRKMISKKDEKVLRKMLELATEPDESLTYNAMRGFLFGLAMTPDMVLPSEWLPMVFGEEMITLDSEEQGQHLLNTLMRVANDFTVRFQEATLRFPFDKENITNPDDLLPIQEWVYGLNEALYLRPDCWSKDDSSKTLTEEQEEILTALATIEGIANPDKACDFFDTQFDDEKNRDERLLASLFLILPAAVDSLLVHASALELERQERLRTRSFGTPRLLHQSPKIGRNDPCPCGSSKKYKKCCLLKEKIVPLH